MSSIDNLIKETINQLNTLNEDNTEALVTIPYKFACDLAHNLEDMCNYMEEDDLANRNDPDFRIFFKVLDASREEVTELWDYISKSQK